MIIGVFAFNSIQAQVTMKDPVSFKLKNGIEVVVAENSGMGKVFASVKIEGEPISTNTAVSEVLTNLLTEGAIHKSKVAFANNGKDIAPKVNITAEEGNVAADAEDFENAFLVLTSTLQKPEINKEALEKANQNAAYSISVDELKTFYNQQIKPSRTYITIAGDITVAQAKALTKKAFAEWKENQESAIAK
ncbi:Peptidase M16 inactive domain protein [compost metagenome]